MEVRLKWSDLKLITEIEYKEDYGIYLWGFMFEDDFLPYYVGIAFNITIPNRLTEHVNNLIGGKYSVIHMADLKHFYKFKNVSEPTDNHGLIYIPNWPKGYLTFLKKRNDLKAHLDNMTDKMCFSYSVLGPEFQTKREYEAAEKACIKSIGMDRLWNLRGGETDARIIEVSGDERITKLFNKI